MKWRQAIPLSITICALLAGFLSILRSASGEYMQAAQLILVSLILDGLDGTFARLLKGTTKLGAEMDTYVDFSSFGLAPAVLIYQAVLQDLGTWGLIIASAVVVSGALRLSRFRIVDPHRGQRGYLGLPITANAGWMALFVFITQSGIVDEEWFSLHHGPLATFVWATVLVFTALQVSHVRYAKPTKDPAILIPFGLFVIMLFARLEVAVTSALAMCAYLFIYGYISPFFHRRHLLVMDEEEEEEEAPVSVRH